MRPCPHPPAAGQAAAPAGKDDPSGTSSQKRRTRVYFGQLSAANTIPVKECCMRSMYADWLPLVVRGMSSACLSSGQQTNISVVYWAKRRQPAAADSDVC
jgi:hypothetical protein